METVKEKIIRLITEKGVSDNDAKKIFEEAKEIINNKIPEYKITWDSPADQYPNSLYNLWFIYINRVAIAWIDKTCPQAWFRSMFRE
jgi:hypothetical protein